MVYLKTYIYILCHRFYYQYLVLLTMVPRNSLFLEHYTLSDDKHTNNTKSVNRTHAHRYMASACHAMVTRNPESIFYRRTDVCGKGGPVYAFSQAESKRRSVTAPPHPPASTNAQHIIGPQPSTQRHTASACQRDIEVWVHHIYVSAM